jgi:WD40 repeat protein
MWLRAHTRLQHDVQRWVDERYATGALLRGPPLRAAEAMLSAVDKDPPLTELQREYVAASSAELRRELERESAQLARRVLDLPDERVAVGLTVALEGLDSYVHTPQLEGAIRTLLGRWPQRALVEHGGIPTTAVPDADGTHILTAAHDGVLRWVDASDGRIVRQVGPFGAPILKAELLPPGNRAAAACGDGFLRLVDLDSGRSRDIELSDEPIVDLARSADGDTLVAASGVGLIVLCLSQDRHHRLLPHPGAIRSVAFHEGVGVSTTCSDGTLRLHRLAEQRTEEFGWPDQAIRSACIDPSGRWIASAGSFGGIRVIDLETRAVRQVDLPGGSALSLALSADGARLAAGDIWGRVVLFDTGTWEAVANHKPLDAYAWDLALNRDGTLFCVASRDGRAVVVDPASGGTWLCAGHNGPVRKVAFAEPGTSIVTAGNDGTVRSFAIGGVPGKLTLKHGPTVIDAELSPNGALLVTAARDGIVRTFDAASGALLATHASPADSVRSAAFFSDDEVVVARADGRIAFVDARSGAERAVLAGPLLEQNERVRATRDRTRLVAHFFDEVVHVLDAATGQRIDLDDAGELERIMHDVHLQLGLVSPAGRIARDDGPPLPFLERDGTAIYLRTPQHQVTSAALAPDGAVVVGSALNRTDLPIFEAGAGELTATLWLDHPSNGVRFGAGGTRILASWLNAVSLVRYPPLPELLRWARSQVNRAPTARERAEFGLPDDVEDTNADDAVDARAALAADPIGTAGSGHAE